MKPQLACDVDFNKAQFPMMLMPKIDGVRALNLSGGLVARSGKPFKNKLNTDFFSDDRFIGFDGEMVIDRITGWGICNDTTSALTTIKGTIPTRWCLFDYVTGTEDPYHIRYNKLCEIVEALYRDDPGLRDRIWVIPYEVVEDQEHVEELELQYLHEGYEGVILRKPTGTYKYGRCTATEANYLRLKRFMDSEIVVTHVIEGQTNHNELTRTPNGYAERATHAENMLPNGMIGTICGRALKQEKLGDTVVLEEGAEIEISPGKMAHCDRSYFFANQHAIIGKIAKFQFFPVGIKDKPRFPTFQCFRDSVDM